MSATAVVLIGVAGLLLLGVVAQVQRRRRFPPVARAVLVDPEHHTVVDKSGAVRSVQAADLTMPNDRLQAIWSPKHLERLARTYWRFLTRATLGFVRVKYTEGERYICLLFRPFKLLTFQAPEYEMDERRGVVRWRIERGFLVSRRGQGGDGYLQIDIERRPAEEPECGVAHVEVEVANFYPRLSGLSQFFYANTQSRIHVIVTHGFLRSLARLDLAESRVGRFAAATMTDRAMHEVPDPPPPGEPAARDEPAREGAAETVSSSS